MQSWLMDVPIVKYSRQLLFVVVLSTRSEFRSTLIMVFDNFAGGQDSDDNHPNKLMCPSK